MIEDFRSDGGYGATLRWIDETRAGECPGGSSDVCAPGWHFELDSEDPRRFFFAPHTYVQFHHPATSRTLWSVSGHPGTPFQVFTGKVLPGRKIGQMAEHPSFHDMMMLEAMLAQFFKLRDEAWAAPSQTPRRNPAPPRDMTHDQLVEWIVEPVAAVHRRRGARDYNALFPAFREEIDARLLDQTITGYHITSEQALGQIMHEGLDPARSVHPSVVHTGKKGFKRVYVHGTGVWFDRDEALEIASFPHYQSRAPLVLLTIRHIPIRWFAEIDPASGLVDQRIPSEMIEWSPLSARQVTR